MSGRVSKEIPGSGSGSGTRWALHIVLSSVPSKHKTCILMMKMLSMTLLAPLEEKAVKLRKRKKVAGPEGPLATPETIQTQIDIVWKTSESQS